MPLPKISQCRSPDTWDLRITIVINPTFRVLFISLGTVAIFWMLFGMVALSRRTAEKPALFAMGNIFIATGLTFAMNGLVIGFFGLESFLSALNHEMVLLPLSLSKVLGITTHLNINPTLPLYIAISGGLLAGAGCLMRAMVRYSATPGKR